MNPPRVELTGRHPSLRLRFDKNGDANPVDGIYNASPILNGEGASGLFGRGCTLEAFCDELAAQPLLFQPGSAWSYGHNTQVTPPRPPPSYCC